MPLDFSFNFARKSFHLFKDTIVVGNRILDNGLFKLYLNPTFDYNLMTFHGNIATKKGVVNEKSSMLWHKRLCYIFIERIKRLVKGGVFKALEFIDFGTCINCIKEKHTTKTKKGARRSSNILELYTLIFVAISKSVLKWLEIVHLFH